MRSEANDIQMLGPTRICDELALIFLNCETKVLRSACASAAGFVKLAPDVDRAWLHVRVAMNLGVLIRHAE